MGAGMSAQFYASLTGPLLGLYYPLPDDLESDVERRVALNTSKLGRLWCQIYPRAEAERAMREHGGEMLPIEYARRLDYDSHAVHQVRRGVPA